MSRKGNRDQSGNEAMRSEARRSEQQNRENRSGIRDGNGGQSAGQISSSDEIAARAYQIFEREGRMDGRDMDHWLQAEQELRTERERTSGKLSAENAPRSARQHQQR